MSEASDRLFWTFWRRWQLSSDIKGFWASRLSYATDDCIFSENNRIYRRVSIRNSSLGCMTYVAENTRIGSSDIVGYINNAEDQKAKGIP